MASVDVLSTDEHSLTPGDDLHLHHHARPDVSRTLGMPTQWSHAEVVSVPVLSEGDGGGRRRARRRWPTRVGRHRRADDVERLDPGVRRLVNPHRYHVSITDELFELKQKALAAL